MVELSSLRQQNVVQCQNSLPTTSVLDDYLGLNTGNGGKLSYCQAEQDQASSLAVAQVLSIAIVESYVVTLTL